MSSETPPVALTIAGTDSGGGAGLAADLKSFAAAGVHGVFAITVVTAQNTSAIRDLFALAPELVGDQIDAVLDDFAVTGTKTGLLYDAALIDEVVVRADRLPNLVVDPVLVTSTGSRLLTPAVERAYARDLLPAALVTTPNVAEATLLTGLEIESVADATEAARMLHRGGVPHAVVTGFLVDDRAVDVHASDAGVEELVGPRVETANVHGTGCSFAAMIAARLAFGDEPGVAIRTAKDFVTKAIRSSARWELGEGHGPIDHSV